MNQHLFLDVTSQATPFNGIDGDEDIQISPLPQEHALPDQLSLFDACPDPKPEPLDMNETWQWFMQRMMRKT